MKIRTKFLAAVLATVMTFGCALSASAWDSKDTTPPAVEFGNSAMPGIKNGNTATATLTLKSSDFADVTGAKLTVKLPEGMTLVKANVTGNGSWVADTDYKVDTSAGTITLIDVFNVGDAVRNGKAALLFKLKHKLTLGINIKKFKAVGRHKCILVTVISLNACVRFKDHISTRKFYRCNSMYTADRYPALRITCLINKNKL